MPDSTHRTNNNLQAYWMPFTANRQFKEAPRMLVGAKGMYYTTDEGKKVLDGCAGMWCVNAGHGREQITEAIRFQAGQMDYATAFQMGHPLAFELDLENPEELPDQVDSYIEEDLME